MSNLRCEAQTACGFDYRQVICVKTMISGGKAGFRVERRRLQKTMRTRLEAALDGRYPWQLATWQTHPAMVFVMNDRIRVMTDSFAAAARMAERGERRRERMPRDVVETVVSITSCGA